MTAPLVFVVPIRHQDAVSDWGLSMRYLTQTLAAIAGQTVSDWECVVVANEGADLPEMPDRCRAEYVDLPVPDLPDPDNDLEGFYDAIRVDKGSRIYAGVRDAAPDSHIMAVDSDDFVSNRLAALVMENRAAPGWNLERGYVWSGGDWCYLQHSFHQTCGTSHIIRRDTYGTLEQDGQVDLTAVKRRLGSHIFIHHDLKDAGRPLPPLPFPGAVYRVGNPQSATGRGTLFGYVTPPRRFLTHPVSNTGRLTRYRRVTPALRQEFSLPT